MDKGIVTTYLNHPSTLKLYAADALKAFAEKYNRESTIALLECDSCIYPKTKCYAVLDLEKGEYRCSLIEQGEFWDYQKVDHLEPQILEDTWLMLAVLNHSLPIIYTHDDADFAEQEKAGKFKKFQTVYRIDKLSEMRRVSELGSIVLSAVDLVNFAAHTADKTLANELCKAYYESLDNQLVVIGHPRSYSTESLINHDWVLYQMNDIGRGTLVCSRFYTTSLTDYGKPEDVAHEVEEIIGALQNSNAVAVNQLLFSTKCDAKLCGSNLFRRLKMSGHLYRYSIGYTLV